ncbi:MAG: serine/threonine protein kinase [Planctomycetota bacterium]|nr:MAG: serine/threonine protein kinase [Planctomycetota bacterium]
MVVPAITQREQGLSKLAIRNGFLTPEIAAELFRELAERRKESSADTTSFDDLAVEKGYMTSQQMSAIVLAYQRLVKDAERRRWAIPGYEIFTRIGEGGLGVVFKARQISMNRIVALKILHKRWLNDEEFKQRFLVEARLVGKLSHQNLIKVFDVGRHDWKYYFSMEFIEGETLEELIEREGPLDVLTAVDVTIQILRAIKYLWRYDIVHCDIKPSNILLTKDRVAKLGDFGFVKSNLEIAETEEGTVLGTPDYISPEQAQGRKDIDWRSDVYSLGVTLYHMLAKTPPYEGTVSTVMRKHIKGELPSPKIHNPKVPDALVRIIERMCAREPDDRYGSFDELFEELELVQLKEKTGRSYDIEKSELVNVLQIEKARSLEQQMEKLELEQRLRRLTAALWVVAGLGLVSLASALYLLAVCVREGWL